MKSKRGFTLIEMMVAVTIFVIVALIIAGITLTIIESLRRALAMKTIIDNLGFAMESMTLELREGRDYRVIKAESSDPDNSLCFTSVTNDTVCFERGTGDRGGDVQGKIGRIYRCEDSLTNRFCQSENWSPLTSSLVDVKNLRFEEYRPEDDSNFGGDSRLSDFGKRYIRIFVDAEAMAGPRGKTTFQLQTVASQRNIGIDPNASPNP